VDLDGSKPVLKGANKISYIVEYVGNRIVNMPKESADCSGTPQMQYYQENHDQKDANQELFLPVPPLQ
jgi:hypothetical protein